MTPACIMVTAHLCLGLAYLHTISIHSGLISPTKADEVAIRRTGARLTLMNNDVPKTGPAGLMEKICGTTCIYYYKHCISRLRCTYWYGELTRETGRPRLELTPLTIEFSSENARRAAEHAIFLKTGNTGSAYFALARLKESKRQNPPTCSTLNRGC
jgi:hypothetical protein